MNLFHRMQHNGLLPAEFSVTANGPDNELIGNLVPLMVSAWAKCATSPDWVTALSHSPHARITVSRSGNPRLIYHGYHGPCSSQSNDSSDTDQSQYVRATPARTIGIASSRIGRAVYKHRNWMLALRTAVLSVRPDETLVTVDGTTCDRFVSRAAALFGIPIVRVRLPDDSQAVGDWLVEILKNAPDSLSVSPPLFDAVSDLPPADCLLFDVSDRLHVLRVRRNSTTERLVRQRLKDVPTPASTWLHQDTPDSAEFLRAEFRKHPGLIDWIVLDIEPPTAGPPSTASAVSARKLPKQSFLTHCTRAADGPWPNETDSDYIDAQLFAQPEATDRSAFATLCRIVTQKRLIGGTKAIRGSFEVVCYSGLSTIDLIDRRTFRSHRGRWDYEPYGIAIAQEWLEQRGARRVIYGDDLLWQELDECDRPWFQLARGKSGINWSLEDEWRIRGTVALQDLAPDSAFVFVATRHEQQVLSFLSAWPVFTIDELRSASSDSQQPSSRPRIS